MIKDGNECELTGASTVPVRATDNPKLSESVTNIKCFNDKGTITINAIADNLEGSSLNSMSLYWIESTNFQKNPTVENTFTELNGDNYTLGAKDSYGCISTKTVEFGEPASQLGIVLKDSEKPFRDIKGSITVTASGGWEGYTITCIQNPAAEAKVIETLIDKPAGDYTFSGLDAAVQYQITITDRGGCDNAAPVVHTLELATSVGDFEANSLKIFPNPSSNGQFTIEWNTMEDRAVTLEVFTVNGKLVYKTSVQTGTGGVRTPLDISSQSRGAYLLRVPELDIKQKLVIQ
jgi:hypothetical protein